MTSLGGGRATLHKDSGRKTRMFEILCKTFVDLLICRGLPVHGAHSGTVQFIAGHPRQ